MFGEVDTLLSVAEPLLYLIVAKLRYGVGLKAM
jgi:hypothetical protein